jgi:hypothetical protein
MFKLKLLFIVLIGFCYSNFSFAQRSDLLCMRSESTVNLAGSFGVNKPFKVSPTQAYPPATRDFKKLTISTVIFFGSSIVVFGVLSLCPEDVSSWNKDEIKFSALTGKWSENVKAGPISDNDLFFFNNVTHPYCGAVYYMTARSCGFKGVESFLYSAIMSTCFWEYGVEAFAEIPSSQDLLITPLAGAALGEVFFNVKKQIMKHDKRVLGSKILGAASLLFLDPFNTILDGAGYKQKVKTKVNITPSLYGDGTKRTNLQLNLTASF